MRNFSKSGAAQRAAVLAGLVIAALQFMPRLALAEPQQTPVIAAPTPIDDFKKQSSDVQKSLQSVLAKIDQSAKEIETLSKPETAHQQIEDLQATIADALGTVADNGPVATLGAKALKFATDKQKQFETDTEFAPEDRAMLLREWKTIRDDTERATADLAKARDEFAQLLRTVQTRGDFIAELQAINNAQRMLEVVRQLAGEIRNTSDAMKAYVRNIVPPGS